jgi:Tfp pilus assembly protein PilN
MNAPNQLSFLPDDYLARKAQRRTNLICAVLFIIVMGSIGSAFTLTERSLRDVERRHTDVQRDYADAAKRLEQVKQMQDNQRKMARQAELSASLLEKIPRSNLLAEITNALPDGVSLIDLDLDSKRRATPKAVVASTAFEQKKAEKKKAAAAPTEVAPPEPKLYDVKVKLDGIASNNTQVAEFIRNLGKCKLLKDVNLAVVDEAKFEDETVRKFTLEMMLSRDVDLQGEGQKPLKQPQQTAGVDLGATK